MKPYLITITGPRAPFPLTVQLSPGHEIWVGNYKIVMAEMPATCPHCRKAINGPGCRAQDVNGAMMHTMPSPWEPAEASWHRGCTGCWRTIWH